MLIENMIKNFVYISFWSCNKWYKAETSQPLKVRLWEYRQTVKLVNLLNQLWLIMYDWKKGANQLLWNEVKY